MRISDRGNVIGAKWATLSYVSTYLETWFVKLEMGGFFIL